MFGFKNLREFQSALRAFRKKAGLGSARDIKEQAESFLWKYDYSDLLRDVIDRVEAKKLIAIEERAANRVSAEKQLDTFLATIKKQKISSLIESTMPKHGEYTSAGIRQKLTAIIDQFKKDASAQEVIAFRERSTHIRLQANELAGSRLLKAFVATKETLSVEEVDYINSVIRGLFKAASDPIKIGDSREVKLQKINKRINVASAFKNLEALERKNELDDQFIESSKRYIPYQLRVVGHSVDEPLSLRIAEAALGAHRRAAEKLIARLEEAIGQYDPVQDRLPIELSIVTLTVERISKHIEAGGLVADEGFINRIVQVKRAGYRIKATHSLNVLRKMVEADHYNSYAVKPEDIELINQVFVEQGSSPGGQTLTQVQETLRGFNFLVAKTKLVAMESGSWPLTLWDANRDLEEIKNGYSASDQLTADIKVRIEKITTAAFEAVANGQLNELESGHSIKFILPDEKSDEIIAAFSEAGHAINSSLHEKIAAATRREWAENAISLLRLAEEPGFVITNGFTPHWTAVEKKIRHAFIAGGVSVTKDGRLPKNLEARLLRVGARANKYKL